MLKDFLIALGNYNKYGELLKRKAGYVAAYVLLLFLICSIGVIVIPVATTETKIVKGLWETIPEFTLTQDSMTIAEEYDVNISGVRLLATNNKQVTAEDFGDCVTGVLFDCDSLIIRNFGKTAEFSYGEFDVGGMGFNFVKADLKSLIPFFVLIGALMCVILFIIQLLSYFFNAVFICLVSSVVAMFMGIIMPIGKHLQLALYAKTLPLVISALLTPFSIVVYSIIEFVLSMLIIVLFFRTIRAEATSAL